MNTPDSTLKYVKLFAEYNRMHGAQTYLFQTWARKKVPRYQARLLRPSVELFDPDGSHPSSPGTLLTACLFVKILSGELPGVLPQSYIIEDANGEIVRLMEADPLDNEFCKRIAGQVLAE